MKNQKKQSKHRKKRKEHKGGWNKMGKLMGEALEVLKNKAGNISATCEALGITRKTFYEWMEKDLEFKEKVEEIRESLIDYAESMLLKNIKEGDTTSIIFYLKTMGSKRGWNIEHKLRLEHLGEIKGRNQDIRVLINNLGYKDIRDLIKDLIKKDKNESRIKSFK